MEPLPWVFDMLQYFEKFRKDFTFSRKPVLRYMLWTAALLGAFDVTQDGRHLGFYLK